LEERIAPAIAFQFDYSYDSLGFFTANPAAKTVLQEAAQILGSQLNNNLAGFGSNPALDQYWDSYIPNPSNMATNVEVSNLTIPANTLVVFVGGSNLSSGTLAESNPGSLNTYYSQDYSNLVHSRGQPGALATPPTAWSPWGGMMSFGMSDNWSFSGTGGLPATGQYDFLTVCEHELCHLLGYGQAPSWFAQVNLSTQLFDGAHAEKTYGGPVPVDATGIHWAAGTTSGGQSPVMSPSLPTGIRRSMTPLDWAGLADIGWNVDQLVVTTPPPGQVAPGSPFGLTVTAEDPTGAVDTLFGSPVSLNLASNPGAATLGGNLTATAAGGVATFSGLTLNQPGTGYTLGASSGTLAGATTTSAISVSTSTDQLVVTTAPPSSVTAGTGFGLTITAEAGSGAVDPNFSGTVTLALAANPGGATLGGTLTGTAVGGVATFSGLTLNKASSGYTLSATAGGLPAATTGPIAVAPAAATQLVVTTPPPAVVTAGAGFGLAVSAWDAFGNVATTYSGSVTLALAASPGGAILRGTTTVNATAGVASFTGLTLNKAASGYVLVASGGTLSMATTSSIQVVAAAASQWVITTQPPATATAGSPFSLTVTAEDSNGNVDTTIGSSVSLTLGANPGAATLGGTTTLSATAGDASFTGLTLNRAASGYTLFASGGTLSAATTSSMAIVPAAAAQWVITTQPPTSVAVGAPFGLAVTAEDSFGNVNTSFNNSVALALGSNPGNAALGGTVTRNATSGLATFTGLTLNQAGAGYTVMASGSSLSSATTSPFNVTASGATQLVVTTQPPSSVIAGTGFGLVVVAEDSLGHVVPSFNGSVSLTLAANPGGATLGGTITINANAGVATFTGLTLNKTASGYTLQASSGSLSVATTSSVTVATAAAAQWVITTQPPASVTAGASFGLVVTAEDSFGNVNTSFNNSVTLALGSNPGGATLRGTVNRNATAGVVTFSGLTLNRAGAGYTLIASGGSLSSATTNPFNVAAGAATQWVVTTQPPATVIAGSPFGMTVTADDTFGNVATTYSGSVSLALAANQGGATLSGTTSLSATAGVATFTGLSLNKVASGYTLTASSGGVTAVTTSSIRVAAAPAAQLVVTTQPSSSATAGSTFSLVVTALDAFGNVATTFGGSVSLTLGANPGGATLGGTTTQSANSGVATFTGLTLNKAVSGYTLVASSGTLSNATTRSITIMAATAAQWVITTQPPASVAPGASFGLTVAAEDRFGNVNTSFSKNVTMAIGNNPGGATLGGTVIGKPRTGMVTFTGLTLSRVGTGYTLIASGNGLSSATTNPFNVATAAATALVAASPPSSSVTASTRLASAVAPVDVGGNADPSHETPATLAVDSLITAGFRPRWRRG
jgi:LysM repeat protein